MTDFTFTPTDFAATQITVVANTPVALEYLAERYGFACVSINIPLPTWCRRSYGRNKIYVCHLGVLKWVIQWEGGRYQAG
jgi:hypothetical protein